VADFAVLDVPTGFGNLEPSHVANGFARSRQPILDCFLKSVWRRANYFNLFVNVFRHALIISRGAMEHNKNPPMILSGVCLAPRARLSLVSLGNAQGIELHSARR
jgi:hypothetical protein